MAEGSAESKSACVAKEDFATFMARYNAYRDYLKHEDTLINFRITWLLTFEAALAAGVGLLLYADEKLAFPAWDTAMFWAILGLVLVGLAFAVSSLNMVRGAEMAICNLEQKWEEYAAQQDIKMPGVVRGGLSPTGETLPEHTPVTEKTGQWQRIGRIVWPFGPDFPAAENSHFAWIIIAAWGVLLLLLGWNARP